MLQGLNHITVAVSNLEKSLAFYIDILGFEGHVKWDTGAYLTLNELWLCLSLDNPAPSKDYSHIAFSIGEKYFPWMASLLKQYAIHQWEENSSEGNSLYILDPDGHKLEIHIGNLASRMKSLKTNPYKGLVWLKEQKTSLV